MRPWTDAQFLLIAISWLPTAVRLAQDVLQDPKLDQALDTFGANLPAARLMRNVHEHADEYAQDRGRKGAMKHLAERGIDEPRKHLQVGGWGPQGFQWLGEDLQYDTVISESSRLFAALVAAADRFTH